MTTELTAAQLDAQADEALEQMESTGWKTPDESGAAADNTAPEANEIKVLPEDEGTGEASADPVDEATLQAIAEGTEREALAELNAGPDPLQFSAQVPDDYKATRAALLAEKADALEKMMGGEMEAKEYAAIEARVMDSLEDLSAQRIRAETLIEANTQTQAQAQQVAISALIVKAKDEVPYATDAKAQRQFDMALSAVGTDPDNAGKPFAHLVNEAHKVVLALRGVQAKPDTQKSQAAPERRAPDTPMTLGGLPNAGGSGEKSVTQVLSGLSGPDFDKAFDALPKDQQQKYLKQA